MVVMRYDELHLNRHFIKPVLVAMPQLKCERLLCT